MEGRTFSHRVRVNRLFHVVRKPTCPTCGKQAKCIDTVQIYGKSYGFAWVCYCSPDGAYVGCHHGTKIPLGTLANEATRQWRNLAHKAFDPLWKGKRACGTRRVMYTRLAASLGIRLRRCHIGQFDVATCKRVIEICGTWTDNGN